MRQAVLINGVPASGKSTVCEALVRHLSQAGLAAVPLGLDTIKEALFAQIGTGDRDKNRMLGRASYQAIFDSVSAFPDDLVPVVDAWHGFQPKTVLREHLQRARIYNVVEVWCRISPGTAASRYRERSATRHSGHPPAYYADELHELAQRAAPLGLGPVVSIDAEAPLDPRNLERVRELLSTPEAPVAAESCPRRTGIEDLAALLARRPRGRRQVICLAGPPAAGKSQVAESLRRALEAQGREAAILPMDGYHYDDCVLTERGLLARKGAPATFDVSGFSQVLARLARNDEPEVAVPVFDRSLEISRGSARIIPHEVDMLIVEGNYLLLDRAPWTQLARRFDATVQITADPERLRERLMARWQNTGLSQEEVRRKVKENDLPNCRLILEASQPADFVIKT